MTTPAQDINESSSVHVLGRRWDGAIIDGGTVVSSKYKLERPASVTSPRRQDGTRGPRAYYSRGMSESLPIATAQWSEDPDDEYKIVWNGGVLPYQQLSTNWGYPTTPPSLWDRADRQALMNAKGSKVNLGTALAEARQTAGLVGQTSRKIGNMVNAWRSKNPKKLWDSVKRGGRSLPSSWLEMSYGWSPLLSDVLGSAEALAESMAIGRRFDLTVRGSAVELTPASWVQEWPGLYDLVYSGQTKHRVEVVLRYDLPASILPTLSSLGLTNPAEVLWEKVPWSFVVDWILPVGDWLHLLDAGHYLQFQEGSRSQMSRTLFRSQYVNRDEFSWRFNKSVRNIRLGLLRRHNFIRDQLMAPPPIPLPSLRNPLSMGHLANGLALLATAFDRKRPSWANRDLFSTDNPVSDE
jgi:hypothetical protein